MLSLYALLSLEKTKIHNKCYTLDFLIRTALIFKCKYLKLAFLALARKKFKMMFISLERNFLMLTKGVFILFYSSCYWRPAGSLSLRILNATITVTENPKCVALMSHLYFFYCIDKVRKSLN